MSKKIVPATPTAAMITAGNGVEGVTDEAADVWAAMYAAALDADTDILEAVVRVTRTQPGIQSTRPARFMQDLLELRQAILGVTIPGPGPKS